MRRLALDWRLDGSGDSLRPRLREAAATPCPAVPGLKSRFWRIDRARLRGTWLFDRADDLAAFEREPSSDPTFALFAAMFAQAPARDSRPCPDDPARLDRPVFIIAAPRSGSTVLHDLLARSDPLWTLGGEGEGPIEGVAPLHPAARDFHSHRLTELDAEPAAGRAVTAGLIGELRDRRGRSWLDLPESARPARPRMLEKTPENCLRIPLLAALYPAARFIFLHRDARQVLSSMVEAWGHRGFVNIPRLPGWDRGAWSLLLPEGWRDLNGASLTEIAAFQWSAANRRAMDDLAAIPRERWTSIDFAEVLAAPAAIARRLLDFVEVEADAGLDAALGRPLAVSGTAISPPSALKWRRNPAFDETILDRHTGVTARLRAFGRPRAPPPPPTAPASPVRFACDLADIVPDARAGAAPDRLRVTPSFAFQMGPSPPLGLVRRTRFRERFRDGAPMVWIEDPATRVLYPLWIPPAQIGLFRTFAAGQPPPPGLPTELMARLLAAGVLVDPRAQAAVATAAGACQARAAETFAEQGFAMLPDLIRPAHVAALDRYYREMMARTGWALGDAQVDLRHGQHNEPVARYFHHQLIDLVARIAGEPVKPTYAYVSAYRAGAVLRPHTDRRQCVFTLSLWLGAEAAAGDAGWPLWFAAEAGPVSVTQAAGDAVLFRGCDLQHWRDAPPPGGAATTLILHYVPAGFAGVLD